MFPTLPELQHSAGHGMSVGSLGTGQLANLRHAGSWSAILSRGKPWLPAAAKEKMPAGTGAAPVCLERGVPTVTT
jgi:hypothetical protein